MEVRAGSPCESYMRLLLQLSYLGFTLHVHSLNTARAAEARRSNHTTRSSHAFSVMATPEGAFAADVPQGPWPLCRLATLPDHLPPWVDQPLHVACLVVHLGELAVDLDWALPNGFLGIKYFGALSRCRWVPCGPAGEAAVLSAPPPVPAVGHGCRARAVERAIGFTCLHVEQRHRSHEALHRQFVVKIDCCYVPARDVVEGMPGRQWPLFQYYTVPAHLAPWTGQSLDVSEVGEDGFQSSVSLDWATPNGLLGIKYFSTVCSTRWLPCGQHAAGPTPPPDIPLPALRGWLVRAVEIVDGRTRLHLDQGDRQHDLFILRVVVDLLGCYVPTPISRTA